MTNLCCRREHQSNELSHIKFTVSIDVSELEDGIHLLAVKLTAGRVEHFLLAQKSVIVGVNPLEGSLHISDTLEVAPQFGENLRGGGTHQVHKLLQRHLAVSVSVAQAEDGVDLHLRVGVTRALESSGQLSLGESSVPVGIKPLEGRPDIVHTGVLRAELVDDGGGGGAHQGDELLVVDLNNSSEITNSVLLLLVDKE